MKQFEAKKWAVPVHLFMQIVQAQNKQSIIGPSTFAGLRRERGERESAKRFMASIWHAPIATENFGRSIEKRGGKSSRLGMAS